MHQEFIDMEYKRLIPMFLKRRGEEIQALTDACANQDVKTLKYLGHRMKGSGRNYGFLYLGDLGEEIENLADRKAFDAIEKAIDMLETYLKTVQIVFLEVSDEEAGRT